MKRVRRKLLNLFGVFAALSILVCALVLADPVIEVVMGLDLLLSLPEKIAIVVGVQLFGIATGCWLLKGPLGLTLPVAVRWITSLGVAGSILLAGYGVLRVNGVWDPHARKRAVWRKVLESEETILSLDPQMQRLGFAVGNLTLPDFQSRQVFDEHIEWNDMTGEQQNKNQGITNDLEVVPWRVSGTSVKGTRNDIRLWSELLQSVAYFDHAKFYVVRGAFVTPESDTFEADLGFDARALMRSGKWNTLHGSIKTAWRRRQDETGQETWRISHWTQGEITSIESSRVLFEDVLDETLPNPEDLSRARTSIHEEFVIDSFETNAGPHPRFTRVATDRHPGVSVVDLNDDGFDDFYVMARWGPNLFFRNNRNGTFSEVAGELGLAIVDHTTCAIFGDFDNDGDKDVFLGRSLVPSMYLENIGGYFEDRSGNFSAGLLPSLVSSVTGVDYNKDGLLDVYFSTYAANILLESPESAAEFLGARDFSRIQGLLQLKETHEYLNMPGPPNRLLRNLGNSEFDDAGLGGVDTGVFRNSYQSTWSDFDNDGDSDLYVANDLAPNSLFRNDKGRFVDIAEETGTTDMGFGMGASWGDYDNDGDPDLYVSNMYSKAGRRITAQFDYMDPRFAQSARGNSMLRNDGNRFDKVSGLEAPAMLVEKAGWSWGAQYVDVDNDGYLDIHALAGNYTSPRDTGLPDL